MDRPGISRINHAVLKAIQKEKSGYINIKSLIVGFPVEIKINLGFEKTVKAKNFTAKDALDRLGPHLDENVQIYQKGSLIYLSLDSRDVMVLRRLRHAKSSPTFKMLRKNVAPLSADGFAQAVNELLADGKVKCFFRGDHPVLSAADSVPVKVSEDMKPVREKEAKKDDAESGKDPEAFRAAMDVVGKGRRMVYIYMVRRHLNWSRERFDGLIRNLRGQYHIQLHGGDPSVMTEDQVKDSFVDEKGVLHISVSWRG